VATNASGVASAAFTTNATAGGPYTVTAAATGLTTVNFFLTNSTAPPPGIKLIQHTSIDAGTVSSSTLAFPASNTAGNWIGVVIRAGHSGQAFTVSDTNKNSYHSAVQFNQTLDVPNGDTLAIFYAENIVGGANSVTVSESLSGNTLRFAILEYSGVSTFNSLDVTAAAQGGSTSPNSGAATTTVGGDLLLGEIMTGTGTTASAGTGYKVEAAVPASPNSKLMVEDEILSGAGSASATATLGASVSWGAALAAFKPPASGGAGPNISGVSPASAMVGAPVTISGSNFGSSQGSSTVTFNGQPAGLANTWSPTSITVNVPQGALTGNLVVTVAGVPSNPVNFTVNSLTVTITPVRSGIEISQTQQFTGTVLYDPQNLGVNWYVDSIFGGNTTVGTISSSGLFSPGTQIGVHTVTAVSMSNSSVSATASIAITDFPGMLTYHNDIYRTGQNLSEYALTPALVNKSSFGKLFSCTVDGAVYAQPLWVPNVTISGVRHNVLLVATAHDSLFAFDADASPCATLWQVNLIDSLHGGTSSGGVQSETTVPAGSTGNLVGAGAGDISPEVGVVGTPVIDPTTNTIYVVSKSVNPNTLKFYQRLHAIDILTGGEKFAGPASISSAISLPGTGGDSSGGQLPFDEKVENQRPGLALANGVVYIGWGSHEDWGPWHGWLMSFNASNLAFISAFCSTPNGNFGGIWMGGGAPAIDSSNNLYVLTGNGDWDGLTSFGDSILKLDSGLSLVTWFTPSDQSFLANNDQDLGSGGAAILIDQPSAPTPHLMIGGGKEGSNQIGELFLLNRDNLGGMTSTDTQPQVVQKFSVGGRIFSTSTFWNNNLYIAGSGTRLKQYTFNPSTEQFTFAQQSNSSYGFPGATAAVSAFGNTNGIAWALDNTLYCTPQSPGCGPTVLHAYDATNISTELWNSTQDTTGKDQAGSAVKFTVPTVANGKVYIGTRTEIDIYGLKPN
jgi:IPT/TIG domain